MGSRKHILDPLWITRGAEGLDPEYHKYVLLAANKKFREKLDSGDVSSFYEIMFHSLNLNNLAIEGSIFDFNMNPVWEDPRLQQIRNHLRKMYQLPEELHEIFKNANYLLTHLMLDYLDEFLDISEHTKAYFANPLIHKEKEIFIVLNKEHNKEYDIWTLRFDKRFKYGWKIDRIQSIEIKGLKENALSEAISAENNPKLDRMSANTNVLFIISKNDKDHSKLVEVVSMAIIFNKGFDPKMKFHPSILEELYEIIEKEQVLPFTIKSWI